MAIIPARIDMDGKIVTNDQRLRLRKHRQEQIQWIAEDDGGPWTVVFLADSAAADPADPDAETKSARLTVRSGSPFGDSTFYVPRAGNVRSGLPTVIHGPRSYKYEVRNADGVVTDDPEVIIDL